MTNESYSVIRNAFCRAIPAEQTRNETENCYSARVRDEIMEICKTKKYTPVVANYLMQLHIDYDFWVVHYTFFRERNTKILHFISKLFADFADNKIESPFVYENFGALLESDTDIALYASGDVDLCASYSDFDSICLVMNKFGFLRKEEKIKFGKCFRVGFAGKIEDMDYRINIMFTPLVRYKLPIRIDCKRILDSANFRYYKDTKIRIPNCEVLLYLNMLRTSVHGYVRSPDIRLYIDIYNATVHQPNWNLIMQWAEEDETLNRIGTVAYIAHSMFHTEIPESVLDLKKDKHTKILKILTIVYNPETNKLNSELCRLSHMKMEFYSDGNGFLFGILGMIFPDRMWLREYYCDEKDTLLRGYFKYIKYIL